MESALKKRFQLFIRVWTIFWSLIVATLFQVNTADLLSSFASQTASTETSIAVTDKALELGHEASFPDRASESPRKSSAESAEAQLTAFGIRFWGHGLAYYIDAGQGLRWQAIAGVLMTGILMSFGAPFWFQKLQILASLRDQKAPQAQPAT
jgi:hypothetical protein